MHRSFDTVDSHRTPAATTTHHCGRRPQALRRQVALTIAPHRPTSYTPPTGGIQPDSKEPGFQHPWHASAAPHRQPNFDTGTDRQTDGAGFSCVDREWALLNPKASVTAFSVACSVVFGCGGPTGMGSGRIQVRSVGASARRKLAVLRCQLPPTRLATVLPVFPFPWLQGFPTTAHVRFESSGRCRRCQITGGEGRHPRAYRPLRTPRCGADRGAGTPIRRTSQQRPAGCAGEFRSRGRRHGPHGAAHQAPGTGPPAGGGSHRPELPDRSL